MFQETQIVYFVVVALSCWHLIGAYDDPYNLLADDIFGTTTTTEKTAIGCEAPKRCVSRPLCPNGTLIGDLTGLVTFRSAGSMCRSYAEVCCAVKGDDNNNNNNKDRGENKTTEISNAWRDCGYRNRLTYNFRILGTTSEDLQTNLGEFPWVIALLDKREYIGGGSLITPNTVLTSGVKVRTKAKDDLVAVAGQWDLDNSDQLFPHQERLVREVILHERLGEDPFSPGVNNVALLVLKSPFDAFQHISTICLPPAHQTFVNERCFVTGWGKTKYGKNGIAMNTLRKVAVPVLSNEECERNLRNFTYLGQHSEFYVHPSSLCAGGEENKDACEGDGGSPLVCPIPGQPYRYYQAGIVSWGLSCGVKHVPGVYANVTHLRPWIEDRLRERHINGTYFAA